MNSKRRFIRDWLGAINKKWTALLVDYGIAHVIPLNDLREHEESEFCHCEPRVEYEENGRIIVHHSYDHREICEMENE